MSKNQNALEELANSITHGVGLLLSLVGSAFMVTYALRYGDKWHIIASLIYCASLIFLYACSTLYHSRKCVKAKEFFNLLDHSAIYLFIAGSYSLLLLTVLRGTTGFIVFGIQWGIALAGILYKYFKGVKSGLVDSFGYLAMGWMVVFLIEDMAHIPEGAFNLIFIGGIFYSVGVIFFLLDEKFRFFHTIWHFFVLGGTTSHFALGLLYLIPTN